MLCGRARPSKALVYERFGILLPDRLIGKYLKRWSFTPQRPIRRALEQRPEQIERWLKDSYPALAARAQAAGALIYWGDETAVKEDANWIRGYAPQGKTPVLATPTRWRKLSMISAISARGQLSFRIVARAASTPIGSSSSWRRSSRMHRARSSEVPSVFRLPGAVHQAALFR